MSIDIRPDGAIRWGCTQCDPRYQNHGPWIMPWEPRDHAALEAAEGEHFEKWHVPAFLAAQSDPEGQT